MMRLVRRLAFWLRRNDDLADELDFHRQMKEAELRARGVAEEEIRAATQRAIGNDLRARQDARDVWLAPWLQDVTQDVRLAFRTLARDRRFAITAMVTLGLGMAVSNTAFHFVNAAMLRDWPFEHPERLFTINSQDPRGFYAGVSYPEYLQWRDHTTAFEVLSADANQSVNVSDDEHGAERFSGHFITHQAFDVVRVSPMLGRSFVPADDVQGAQPVAILGYDLWRNRYGSDPALIGRIIRINGQPATVVGVMPEGFQYPLIADLWLPMSMLPGIRNATWRSTGFRVTGRLKDGASLNQARQEVATVAATTLREHSDVDKARVIAVIGVRDGQLAGGARELLWAFLAASIIVLLLASANVTNLLLARAWQRARETAVRVALGASRWRVVRQALTECLLVGGGGAVLGGYLSFAGFRAMSTAFNIYEAGAFDRPRKPFWYATSPDAFGWIFMGVVFLLGSLAAGVIPAIHVSRTNANDVLAGGRDGHAARVSRRWAATLMAAQLAIAMMLLSAGGLFARHFLQLYRIDPVVAIDGLVSMRLTLPSRYESVDQRRQFIRQLDERLSNTQAFSGSTIGDVPVQTIAMTSRSIWLDGEALDPSKPPRTSIYVAAGPRYFDLLKIPVLRGRGLVDGDELRGRESAVINERFAAVFFKGVDPIGQRIRVTQAGPVAESSPLLTIIGVVPTISDYNPNHPDDPMVFAPLLADPAPSRAMSVIVRSDSKAAAAAALRSEIAALDRELPIYSIQTLHEQLAMTRMAARMVGSWFQALAIIALVLSSIGLYALTSHAVAQRQKEIGVRMTLGAQPAQVLTMFVRTSGVIVATGVVIGIIAAFAANRLLVAFLGGVNPRDPLTLLAVTTLLVAVAFIAAVIPARRAARIDPIVALRMD